jgi:mevalonate kinase
VLLEKFNGKYVNLNTNQKTVLKEFINSVDSAPTLRQFYNTKINEIKQSLSTLNKKVDDKAVKIKINEVSNLLVELGKTDNVNNDDLVNLLQYYELLEELTTIHGQK